MKLATKSYTNNAQENGLQVLLINKIKMNFRARPGFEPGTSRTLSENHTPRPSSQPQRRSDGNGNGWGITVNIQNHILKSSPDGFIVTETVVTVSVQSWPSG